MTVEVLASAHYRRQQILARRATETAQRAWDKVDTDDIAGTWLDLVGIAADAVSAAQFLAATGIDAYVDSVLEEQGLDIDRAATVQPRAFAGVASDGRRLHDLLLRPAVAAKTRIQAGLSPVEAVQKAAGDLVRIAATQVQDAGRAAAATAVAARPAVDGYVRKLQTPSCDRCTVLASRFYRWSSGFRRHPICDCIHIPSTRANSRDLIVPADGIDSTGREGTAIAGTSSVEGRAMPEELLERTSDRREAIDALRRAGYLA